MVTDTATMHMVNGWTGFCTGLSRHPSPSITPQSKSHQLSWCIVLVRFVILSRARELLPTWLYFAETETVG